MTEAELKYLLARGQGLETQGLNPEFAARMVAALMAGEKATGSQAQISDLYRSPERQARYYKAYKSGQGGLAAPPGRSRHQLGEAADIRRGPVRDWLAKNSGQFGIEPLKPALARMDPVHFQMTRDWAGTLPATQAAAGGGGLPNISMGLVKATKAATQAIPAVAQAARNFKVPGSAQLTAAKYLPASLTGANKIRDALSQGINTAQGMFKPSQAAPQPPPRNLAGIGPPMPGMKPPGPSMAGGNPFAGIMSGLANAMMPQQQPSMPQQTNFTTGVPVTPPRQSPMGPPPNSNRGLELVKILMARDPRMAESVMQLLMKGA